MSAIWSRRNFIRVSALCTIAAAVPVAAAKAAGKVVYGEITGVVIDGKEYVVEQGKALWENAWEYRREEEL